MEASQRDPEPESSGDDSAAIPIRSSGAAPRRPLLEAILVFAVFWLGAYLPGDPSGLGRALGLPSYHLGLLIELLPKLALLLYLMANTDGLKAFGVSGVLPRPAELATACVVALGALCLAFLPGMLAKIMDIVGAATGLTGGEGPIRFVNPLLDTVARPEASPYVLIPLSALSALTVGYQEELFFRVYLARRLAQAGLTPVWIVLTSALVFGSAHGAQGFVGLGVATLLGLFFAWRWFRARNYHEIALAHGLYDFIVLLVTFYG